MDRAPGSRPAGVVLAAGLGTRLRPLTDLRPKPLCPVNNVSGLDRAFELLEPHCGTGPEALATNAFHLADQVVAAVGERAQVSVETELMGTAGGLAHLATWRAGRAVLLVNGDAYLAATTGRPGSELAPLVDGWDGATVRMLVRPVPAPGDFTDARGHWRYVGGCLLPGELLDPLPQAPGGLFTTVWQVARQLGLFELIEFGGTAIDTGTPAGYLAANLHASGGHSVVGAGARVDGGLSHSVVWPGAYVGPAEYLNRCIRAGTSGTPVTVRVDA